jgi:hypothetical protein
MNDTKYWNMIATINWTERCHEDFDVTKRSIMISFKASDLKELTVFVRDRWNELYTRINAYEKDNDVICGQDGGDDSFGDMINHVIGMGKETFDIMMANPLELDDIDFVESFSYILPYEDDFINLNPEHHTGRAIECIAALQLDWEESSNPIANEISDRMVLASQEKFIEAVDGFDKAMYTKYHTWNGCSQHARYSNVLSDIKNWMT